MQYLSCQNLELQANQRVLISLLSFSLGAGEKLAFIGQNGCGKTSLLRVLASISKPAKGKVIVLGEEIFPSYSPSYEHNSVFLSHTPSLLMDYSVLANLKFYLNNFKLKKDLSEYKQALAEVGLDGREKQISRTLSAGQKRRLTLAAISLIKPNILLADEPTNDLDEEGVNLSLQIFDRLITENKCAVIVSSHDEKLIKWCDKTILLTNFAPKKNKFKTLIKTLP